MRKWDVSEDTFLRNNYVKLHPAQCAQQLRRSLGAVYQRANWLGLSAPRPCCQVDETYFDVIDTPNKAYVLGFLAADGFVFEKPGVGYCIQWGQQARDAQILEDIAKDMKYDGGIKIRTIKKRRRDGSPIRVAYLYIYSQKLVSRLKELEAHELNTEFVPDHLLRHWLRGFFDGDGSCGNRTECAGVHMRFFVEPKYVERFERVLSRLGLPVPIYHVSTNSIKIGSYQYRTVATNQVRSLIFDESSLYLRRKWSF